jgi:hypothetical protein
MFKNIKLFYVVFCVFLIACTSTKNKPLSIHFSTDSNKIVISNIEPAGLFQLKEYLNRDTAYQSLVSVLQTPAENDSIGVEIDWPGKLSLTGDSLLFTPNYPFTKGKNYLVETMINVQFASGKDIVRSDVGHYLKAQQKMLER